MLWRLSELSGCIALFHKLSLSNLKLMSYFDGIYSKDFISSFIFCPAKDLFMQPGSLCKWGNTTAIMMRVRRKEQNRKKGKEIGKGAGSKRKRWSILQPAQFLQCNTLWLQWSCFTYFLFMMWNKYSKVWESLKGKTSNENKVKGNMNNDSGKKQQNGGGMEERSKTNGTL